jgi:predicted NUDIX family NTP pyrophosphohydrolase
MAKKSAGMLLWKRTGEGLRFLLVHPGGPFWRNKDQGAWSLPKGEYDDSEDALAAAKRELVEELGPAAAPAVARQDAAFIPLGEVKQKGGKVVTAFALEGDFDVTQLASNTFEIEWPPKSGRRQPFPEADRAQWFSLDEARTRILPAQLELLTRADRLSRHPDAK